MHKILSDHLVGVYLTGSAVLDDWHEGKSDMGFTVIFDKPIQPSDILILNNLYKNLDNEYPSTKIEVQYLPLDLLESVSDIKPTLKLVKE